MDTRVIRIQRRLLCSTSNDYFFFRSLDLGAVVSWLSEGTKLQETKSSSGEIIRQEFHERSSHASSGVQESPELVGSGDEAETEPKKKVLTLEKKLFNIHEDTTRTFFICDLTRKKVNGFYPFAND